MNVGGFLTSHRPASVVVVMSSSYVRPPRGRTAFCSGGRSPRHANGFGVAVQCTLGVMHVQVVRVSRCCCPRERQTKPHFAFHLSLLQLGSTHSCCRSCAVPALLSRSAAQSSENVSRRSGETRRCTHAADLVPRQPLTLALISSAKLFGVGERL